jgi:hypothetical protein
VSKCEQQGTLPRRCASKHLVPSNVTTIIGTVPMEGDMLRACRRPSTPPPPNPACIPTTAKQL